MRWLAPGALAVVFAFAAGAKFADLEGTEAGFRALGLRTARWPAVTTPLLELVIAVLLLVEPRFGAALALAMLAIFSLLLASAIRRGSTAPCRCFGELSNRPVSPRDLARNGALAVLALATLVWPP